MITVEIPGQGKYGMQVPTFSGGAWWDGLRKTRGCIIYLANPLHFGVTHTMAQLVAREHVHIIMLVMFTLIHKNTKHYKVQLICWWKAFIRNICFDNTTAFAVSYALRHACTHTHTHTHTHNVISHVQWSVDREPRPMFRSKWKEALVDFR